MVWREDYPKVNEPTAGTVVIAAEDEVEKGAFYRLVICHVHSFRGKAFMASVRVGRFLSGNGWIFVGTDQDAYDKAVIEGKAILEKKVAKLNESMDENQFIKLDREVNDEA